jgi:Transmembrane amino acid transporter protein
MAQLGWAGGTVFLVFSILVSWYTYKLLAYMHEVPDLDAPKRLRRLDRYDELAQYLLGECACLVLCLAALAYVANWNMYQSIRLADAPPDSLLCMCSSNACTPCRIRR